MLFLAGFAFVTLKNLRSAESIRNANGGTEDITIISGAWYGSPATANDDQRPFVQFQADGKIAGFAGCNRFFGTFVATDSTLEIAALGSTRMMCAESIMQQEMAFLKAIESANRYTISAQSIALANDDGNLIQLTFKVIDDDG